MHDDHDGRRACTPGARQRAVAPGAGIGMIFGAALGAAGPGLVLGATVGLTAIVRPRG